MRLSIFSSTSRGVLPGASPVRLPMRKMCVSTAIVACPKAEFSTTFAVLRPTPGRASSASRVRGTWPPCSVTSIWQVCSRCLALLWYRPMVLMKPSRPSSPKSRIPCGVFATAYSLRVALLTLTSVACAESKTAVNNSNTLVYSNSVTGCGFAAFKVAKNRAMSSLFIVSFSHAIFHATSICRSP